MDETETISLPAETKHPAGRPSMFTREIGNEICQRIAKDESLLAICKDEHMPDRDTVHKWLLDKENPMFKEFIGNYVRARELQPEATYERLFEIEQMTLSGELNPNAARVILDSMHWRMAKRAPKTYGDIRQLDVSGGIDLNVTPVRKTIGSGETRIEHQAAHQIAQDAGEYDSDNG